VIDLLDKTGFRSYSEFIEATDEYERRLLLECHAAYHEERERAMDSGGSGPSMPGL